MTRMENRSLPANRDDVEIHTYPARPRRTCIKGDTVLMHALSGWPVTVGGLVDRHDGLVLTMREAGVLAPQRPAAFIAHAATPLYRLTTHTGRTIEAAADQPFLTRDGWMPLSELEPADAVAVVAEYPQLFGRGNTDADLVKLLAFLTASGTSGDGATSSMADAEVRQDFAAAVDAKGDVYVELLDEDGGLRLRVCGRNGARSRVLSYLDLVGVHGVCGPDKHIPDFVFGLRKETLRLYLNRLFTVDGQIEPTGRIRYRAPSVRMARQVQHLLARFGVVAVAGRTERHVDTRHGSVGGGELVIGTKTDLVRFIEEVGFLGHKAHEAESVRASLYHVRVVDPPLDRLGGILFDRVVRIEATESAPVYDLGIEGSGNFIANDFVVRGAA
jgi:replicative DNA helicase